MASSPAPRASLGPVLCPEMWRGGASGRMTPNSVNYRLSIDLDAAGNPVGSSFKVWHDEQLVGEFVNATPPPFNSLTDVLADLVEQLRLRYGRQLLLF